MDSLTSQEQMICINCIRQMPFTNFHDEPFNIMEQRIVGKTNFYAATALAFFKKKSSIQSLIHNLKYRARPEIGFYLGQLLGAQLRDTIRYSDVDYIMPVPLHPKKLKKRGYNQCQSIAEGIAEELMVAVDNQSLTRKANTTSQTNKSVYDRWKNVSQIFHCSNKERFEFKHILLVDDVFTSGSTIEGCLHSFGEIPGVRLSVATLACAE